MTAMAGLGPAVFGHSYTQYVVSVSMCGTRNIHAEALLAMSFDGVDMELVQYCSAMLAVQLMDPSKGTSTDTVLLCGWAEEGHGQFAGYCCST